LPLVYQAKGSPAPTPVFSIRYTEELSMKKKAKKEEKATKKGK
jgi:hypothetical protein